jgi:transcriptional regulator with PAS, ATPase and Fis domain
MDFSRSAMKQKRVLRMKALEDAATINRKIIDGKLKEASIIDQQLTNLLNDTKTLTKTVREKLSGRLKINSKTLKSICRRINEGVVILNSDGVVLEANKAFEDLFLDGNSIINNEFKSICDKLQPTNEYGEKFSLSPNFKELARSIFDSKDFITPIQPEISLFVNQKDSSEQSKCIFSLTVLDNDPNEVEDVTFMLFFKCLMRSTDRERRHQKRHAQSSL